MGGWGLCRVMGVVLYGGNGLHRGMSSLSHQKIRKSYPIYPNPYANHSPHTTQHPSPYTNPPPIEMTFTVWIFTVRIAGNWNILALNSQHIIYCKMMCNINILYIKTDFIEIIIYAC